MSTMDRKTTTPANTQSTITAPLDGPLPVRALITLAIATVLAVWSMVAINVDAETAPFLAIAERVETSGVKDLGFLARVDRVLAGSYGQIPCPRDLLRSAVTIRLARLDGAYRKAYAIDWAGLAVEADSL